MMDASDKAPAGWYPDPEMVDTQRYWDGQVWTEHRAPLEVKRAGGDDGLVTAGWICAILFPLIGLVIGLVLIGKGNDDQGGWIAACSIGVMVLFFALIGLA